MIRAGKLFLWTTLGIFVAVGTPLSQQQSGLVQIDAIVTDAQGQPVTDLTRGDFQILQDGRSQPIAGFSRVSAGPRLTVGAGPMLPSSQEQFRRTIAIAVDAFTVDSGSMARVRNALNQFFDTQTRDGDVMALLSLGHNRGGFEQFTTDRLLLKFLVTRLEFNPFKLIQRSHTVSLKELIALEDIDKTPAPGSEQESQLLEASRSSGEVSMTSLRALVDEMKGMPGHKSIILFSTGLPDGPPLRRLIETADRAGVAFYTIDPRDPSLAATQVDTPTRLGLATLASETSGVSWVASTNISQSLAEALADQESYYLLEYDPGEATFDLQAHKIEIGTLRVGLRLRSRTTFAAPPDGVAAEYQDSAAILSSLVSLPYRKSTLRTTLSSFFSRDGGHPTLRSVAFINGRDLQAMRSGDGPYRGAVQIMAAVIGANGEISGKTTRTFRFSMDGEEWRRTSATGFALTIPHPAGKPGQYSVRLAVRDAVSGETGSASSFVIIPDLKNDELASSALVLSAPASETAAYPLSSPAIRTFLKGRDIAWTMEIYHAHPGPRENDGLPQLEWSAQISRDGRMIRETPFRPAVVQKLSGGKDVVAQGILGIGNDLERGEYGLEVIVRDQNGTKGENSQRTNFRVIPLASDDEKLRNSSVTP